MQKECRVFLQYQLSKNDGKCFFVRKTINVSDPLPGIYIDQHSVEKLIETEDLNVEIELPAAARIL